MAGLPRHRVSDHQARHHERRNLLLRPVLQRVQPDVLPPGHRPDDPDVRMEQDHGRHHPRDLRPLLLDRHPLSDTDRDRDDLPHHGRPRGEGAKGEGDPQACRAVETQGSRAGGHRGGGEGMSRFEDLHFPDAPRIAVEPPGPKTLALLGLQEKYESAAVLYPKSLPLAIDEGRGSTVKDVDGNLFLDFYAGISVLNLGHSNPAITKAAEAQLRRLTHSLDFPHEVRLQLVRALIDSAPGKLRHKSRVLFGSPSGADAIESALKLARHHRNRYAVISFEGSYHGQSAGAMALGSQVKPKSALPPLAPETHFAPFPYCYRCPFGKGPDRGNDCCMEPARHLERILTDPYSGIPEPAAVVLEPVQGEGGIIEAPLEFLRELRRITEERDIPLIVDEIQAGLGRTGDLYACEAAGITPDLMPIAKSLGGGLPLSALVVRPELDAWEPGAHVGTFRGNLVAMAAGVAALQFMEREKVLAHTRKTGAYLKRRLEELAEAHSYMGDVRGRGLMLGVEFVTDPRTKEPWKEGVVAFQQECFRRGLLVWKAGHFGNVLRLLPPLVTTAEQAEKGADILEDVAKTVRP